MELNTAGLLVPKDQIWKNPNTDYEISEEMQRKFMNGNAQFLLDLATNLKVYSISNHA